jgi:hypothetical protein
MKNFNVRVLREDNTPLDARNLPTNWCEDDNLEFRYTKELNEKLNTFVRKSQTYFAYAKKMMLGKNFSYGDAKRFYDSKNKMMYFRDLKRKHKGRFIQHLNKTNEIEELFSIMLDHQNIKGNTNCTYLCEGEECNSYLNDDMSNMRADHTPATEYYNKLNLCESCYNTEKDNNK